MATTSEASRLQKAVYVMRSSGITVGLLALLALTACGVGVDDTLGQQAAYGPAVQANGQALVGLDGTPAVDPATQDTPIPQGSGPIDPGVSSLPTDPVPWRNPLEAPIPPGDPMGTGA